MDAEKLRLNGKPLLTEDKIADGARKYLERLAERGSIIALKTLCQLDINRVENMNRLNDIMEDHEEEEVRTKSAITISMLYGAKKSGESWTDKPLKRKKDG